MENKDFKYILQDITKVFLGKELTYGDLLEMEEVPFKLKALTNNYFLKDSNRDERIIDHIGKIASEDFSNQIYDQLKIRIKLNCIMYKKTLFGKEIKRHVSIECGLQEYKEQYRDKVVAGEAFVEEIIISKLALMALSC